MRKVIAEFAKHDPACCLAPGLFRSLKKGERKKNSLDITYIHGETEIRFRCVELLGVDDLRLLLVIVSLSAQSNLIIDLDNPEEGNPKILKNLIDPNSTTKNKQSSVLKTNLYRLIKEIGYSSNNGRTRKQVLESIKRLSNVTIYCETKELAFSMNLLSFIFDKNDNSILIANNPRITDAIFGKSPYSRINLNELRMLKTDTARLIHQRISTIISSGNKKRIKLDTILDYSWEKSMDSNTRRIRKMRVKKAMKEIQNTKNWICKEEDNGCFLITHIK